MKILGVIPARFESSRFPGKPLSDIFGKTMIQRVYEQCLKAESLTKLIVATDDQRIYNEVKRFGGEVIMTRHDHLNGTSRCAEVAESTSQVDYIINIQGDEPLIHPEQINELAILFKDKSAEIVTQAEKETNLLLLANPNIVKVILNDQNFAVDFIRTLEPSTMIQDYFYKHVGLYGFKQDVLKKIVKLAPTKNEVDRKLEQMRWLDNGFNIKAGITDYESMSIDTPEDLEKIRSSFRS